MRRLIAGCVAGILSLAVFAGCSSDSSVKLGDAKAKVEKNGDTLTLDNGDGSVSIGGNKLPADFPKGAVPRPADGTLLAAIANPGTASFTLNYAVDGANVAAAAKRYKQALEDRSYRIESSASAGAAAAVFSAFTAIGKSWDVVVYSSGDTGAAAGLALQVTKHNQALDPDPNATTG